MNDLPKASMWERSSLVRFFRWLFSWNGIRRVLIVFAWAVALTALLYGFENWRGRRAWNKVRHQLEARGELLDFKGFIPEQVPPEQNFAATPFIESWFVQGTFTDNDQRWGDAYSKVRGKVSSSKVGQAPDEKGFRHFTDLVAWQRAFAAIEDGKVEAPPSESGQLDQESRAKAAPAVLEALRGSEVHLAELRRASRRARTRYPVNYKLDDPWGILLPHLANIKAACLRLQLRASAKLALGQTNDAFEDVNLILYLADSVKDEPIVISYLVRAACLQIAIQPIWEGLVERQWSEPQLQHLQSRLAQYDFIADMDRPLDSERAAGVLTADLLYRNKYSFGMLVDETAARSFLGGSLGVFLGRVAPRGWYYLEQVNHCRLYDLQLQGSFDTDKRQVFPQQIEANERALKREIAGGRLGRTLNAVVNHQLLASLLLPALGKVPLRAAMAQTAADHAALACALERHRLARGQFPEQPDALAPHYIAQLPRDPVTGSPYKYRLNKKDHFTIYSVGWNEIDDCGTPGPTLFHDRQGDWVWRSR